MKKNDPKIEEQVIEMVTKGKSRKEVAAELGLTYSAVSHILIKRGKENQMKEKFTIAAANRYINNIGPQKFALEVFQGATKNLNVLKGVKFAEAISTFEVNQSPVSLSTVNYFPRLTSVMVQVEPITVNISNCTSHFSRFFAETMMGEYEALVAQDKSSFTKRLSKAVWQGYSVDVPLPEEEVKGKCVSKFEEKYTPGFLKLLEGVSKEVENPEKLTPSNIITEMQRMIGLYPHEDVELSLHISPAHFQSIVFALVNTNNFKWDENLHLSGNFMLPGGNINIISQPGLAAQGTMILDRRSLTVGTDFDSDKETYEYRYDYPRDSVNADLKLKIGMAVSIPQEVLVYREPKA